MKTNVTVRDSFLPPRLHFQDTRKLFYRSLERTFGGVYQYDSRENRRIPSYRSSLRNYVGGNRRNERSQGRSQHQYNISTSNRFQPLMEQDYPHSTHRNYGDGAYGNYRRGGGPHLERQIGSSQPWRGSEQYWEKYFSGRRNNL